MTTITALPTAPSRADPTNFATRADAWISQFTNTTVTEINTVAGEVNTNATTASTAASTATTQATNASNSASAAASAAASAGAVLWVSGTTYTLGYLVYSPITYQVYRRIVAGAGTTDPSADATNWVGNSGNVLLTATQTLTNKTIHGDVNTITVDGINAVGFRHIPQNSQSTAYTAVLADAGKHILHPSADTTARTFTIPANSSVAYPIGTALTFINQASAGVVTIAITTDTMRLAGAGTTGSRTLAANGVATAVKLTATEWIISGTGLT